LQGQNSLHKKWRKKLGLFSLLSRAVFDTLSKLNIHSCLHLDVKTVRQTDTTTNIISLNQSLPVRTVG